MFVEIQSNVVGLKIYIYIYENCRKEDLSTTKFSQKPFSSSDQRFYIWSDTYN